MNTIEVKIKNKINSWDDLYKFAKKQFLEYEKIEGRNWNKYDFSIDCAEDQLLFKDMLQIRCIEELTEASEVINEEEHFKEEITDAINFFLSSYCMLNVNFDTFENVDLILKNNTKITKYSYEDVCYYFYLIIQDIGNLCNLLKNRPWAQSNYLVSMIDFEKNLHKLWGTFWRVIWGLGFTSEDIFRLFEKKYEVNKWRIKTGY